jgi:hypothetical protein
VQDLHEKISADDLQSTDSSLEALRCLLLTIGSETNMLSLPDRVVGAYNAIRPDGQITAHPRMSVQPLAEK